AAPRTAAASRAVVTRRSGKDSPGLLERLARAIAAFKGSKEEGAGASSLDAAFDGGPARSSDLGRETQELAEMRAVRDALGKAGPDADDALLQRSERIQRSSEYTAVRVAALELYARLSEPGGAAASRYAPGPEGDARFRADLASIRTQAMGAGNLRDVNLAALALFRRTRFGSGAPAAGLGAEDDDPVRFPLVLGVVRDIALHAKHDDVRAAALALFRYDSQRAGGSHITKEGIAVSPSRGAAYTEALLTVERIAMHGDNPALRTQALQLLRTRMMADRDGLVRAAGGLRASPAEPEAFGLQLALVERIAESSKQLAVKEAALDLFRTSPPATQGDMTELDFGLSQGLERPEQYEAVVRAVTRIAAGAMDADVRKRALTLFEAGPHGGLAPQPGNPWALKEAAAAVRRLASGDPELAAVPGLAALAERVERSWTPGPLNERARAERGRRAFAGPGRDAEGPVVLRFDSHSTGRPRRVLTHIPRVEARTLDGVLALVVDAFRAAPEPTAPAEEAYERTLAGAVLAGYARKGADGAWRLGSADGPAIGKLVVRVTDRSGRRTRSYGLEELAAL
ncbi:MAG: hypothetical protein KGL53_14410, partial [Elusimicrobia bacterium]|nr:hypothetical protein [Elusimicrobiota bacterium]